jgi:hypothetical protein
MACENHWLPGFNFNVEESDAKGQTHETGSRDHGSEPLTVNETYRAYLFLRLSFRRMLCT